MQASKTLSPKITATILIATSLIVAGLCAFPAAGLFVLSLFFGEKGENITLTVRSTDDDQPVLIYDQRSITYSRYPFANIDILDVLPSNPALLESKSVWLIREDDGERKKPLLSLTYGQCPHGFKQVIPPKPLLTGHYYLQGGTSDIIKKVGPKRYEVMPFWDFLQAAKNGKIHDANPEPPAN